MIPVGLTLQPEEAYLDALAPLLDEEADYYEVAPETLWRRDGAGALVPNGFHRLFLERRERTGRPFVAHGVGLSLGTADDDDPLRLRAWLDRIRGDHRRFEFAWYTDHLGATTLDGRALTLPVPLPMTPQMAARVRTRLTHLQTAVPDVGFENAVFYFLFGRPLDEPAFFREILTQPRMHLLLDLHNVYTMGRNFGFDPNEYVDRLDLSRVIEIHISGGSDSEPSWLPSRSTMRLDSHDGPVPGPVWALLERVVPRCPGLRGVTLERMEGTVRAGDVALLREEMRRAKGIAAA
ncbi:MAG TPA: DUF692 family protein [Planctomycetota bacterium]|nr:DUF692 family protein [Planctomycetota bacterium]